MFQECMYMYRVGNKMASNTNSPLLRCDCFSAMSLAGISHLHKQIIHTKFIGVKHAHIKYTCTVLTLHRSCAHRPVIEYTKEETTCYQ